MAGVIHVEKLTAAQVRQLMVGSTVYLIGRDRHGYTTQQECLVVQSGKKKVLQMRDYTGTITTKPIRDYPGKYYTEKSAF